ncbi:hypothetical protein [Methylomonas sp. MgM2]
MKVRSFVTVSSILATIGIAPTQAQATLIGLTPELPTIEFGASGHISYQASTGLVTISGTPGTLFSIDPFINGVISGVQNEIPKNLSIQFKVDGNGNLTPNDSTSPNLTIIGSVDTNFDNIVDFSGTLLTANVTQFGYFDGVSGNDQFDLSLNSIGGELAFLYSGQSLAASVISFASQAYPNPFSGSFSSDWQGQASGVIGLLLSSPVPVPPSFWLWAGALSSIIPGIKRIGKCKP